MKQVRIQNTAIQFDVDADETILQAAQRQTIDLPFSCEAGVCGACRSRLRQGNIEYDGEIFGLLPEEAEGGFILTCSAYAKSDLVLDMSDNNLFKQPVAQDHFRAHVLLLEPLGDEVYRALIEVESRFDYSAGQYINVIVNDKINCPLSIANRPTATQLELHIRKTHEIPSWGNWVLQQLEQGKSLTISAPQGKVCLPSVQMQPVLLVAGGTGFSQIKALLEQLWVHDNSESFPVYLYWGARHRDGLYCHQQVKDWLEQHTNFRYTPVLSAANRADRWGGRTGLVHDAVIDDFDDLSNFQVYAAGPVDMVRLLYRACLSKGLTKAQFHSDLLEFLNLDD